MGTRTPVYAALAGVVAPAATIRLVGGAVARGLVEPATALAALVVGPLAAAVALVAAAWVLGVYGSDPLDRIRTRPTVRERIPEDAQAHLTEETLALPATEGTVPPGLFRYGLLYCAVVPLVSLVLMG
jgi:hypothetical protein